MLNLNVPEFPSQDITRTLEWATSVRHIGIPYCKTNSHTQLSAKIMNWFSDLKSKGVTAIHSPEFSRMPQFSEEEYSFSNASNANTYYQAFLTLGLPVTDYSEVNQSILQLNNITASTFEPYMVTLPTVGVADQKVIDNILSGFQQNRFPAKSNICNYFSILSFTKALLLELTGVNLKYYKSRLVYEIEYNIRWASHISGDATKYIPYFISTSSYSIYYEAFKEIVLRYLDNEVATGLTLDDILYNVRNKWNGFADDFNQFLPQSLNQNVQACFDQSYIKRAVELYVNQLNIAR